MNEMLVQGLGSGGEKPAWAMTSGPANVKAGLPACNRYIKWPAVARAIRGCQMLQKCDELRWVNSKSCDACRKSEQSRFRKRLLQLKQELNELAVDQVETLDFLSDLR